MAGAPAGPVSPAPPCGRCRPVGRRCVSSSPGNQRPGPALTAWSGPDRNLALIRSNIDLVKKVAHTYHATVNDVLLTATADGLPGLLRCRGDPVEDAVSHRSASTMDR